MNLLLRVISIAMLVYCRVSNMYGSYIISFTYTAIHFMFTDNDHYRALIVDCNL